jgi:hypothetical protein
MFPRVSSACWSTFYASSLRNYKELCDCFFLSSSFEDTCILIEYVLSHVSQLIDRSAFFELNIQSFNQRQMMAEGLGVGLQYLAELGVRLVEEMPPDLAAWCNSVKPDDEESFKQHPVLQTEPMSSALDLISMRVLAALVPSTYVMPSTEQFKNVVLTMLSLSFAHGPHPATALAFACLGVILWSTNQLSLMHAFSQLTKLLLDQFGLAGHSHSILPQTQTMILGFHIVWKKPLRICCGLEVAAVEEALLLRDHAWATWQFGHQHAQLTAKKGMHACLARICSLY